MLYSVEINHYKSQRLKNKFMSSTLRREPARRVIRMHLDKTGGDVVTQADNVQARARFFDAKVQAGVAQKKTYYDYTLAQDEGLDKAVTNFLQQHFLDIGELDITSFKIEYFLLAESQIADDLVKEDCYFNTTTFDFDVLFGSDGFEVEPKTDSMRHSLAEQQVAPTFKFASKMLTLEEAKAAKAEAAKAAQESEAAATDSGYGTPPRAASKVIVGEWTMVRRALFNKVNERPRCPLPEPRVNKPRVNLPSISEGVEPSVSRAPTAPADNAARLKLLKLKRQAARRGESILPVGSSLSSVSEEQAGQAVRPARPTAESIAAHKAQSRPSRP